MILRTRRKTDDHGKFRHGEDAATVVQGSPEVETSFKRLKVITLLYFLI